MAVFGALVGTGAMQIIAGLHAAAVTSAVLLVGAAGGAWLGMGE